ncbi:hypothetical protein [uncultured Thomasclavelia sp.]|uniref:hypothetical protein n=1 Tax=uncultured Thomasclavelia sp. TaxID=3025759 RepID=UPI0025D28EBE|nr:hypothetical protein [uncultured Thomasclavelia sp.]
MNAQEAQYYINQSKRKQNEQMQLKASYQKNYNAASYQKNQKTKQVQVLKSNQRSLEKRLEDVNSVIKDYSKICQSVSTSNQSLKKVHDLLQESIHCDSIASADFYSTFQLKDIYQDAYSNQSLTDLNREKQRLETAITNLKKQIDNIENQITQLSKNMRNYESVISTINKSLNTYEYDISFYKKYL